jgi:NADH dehydrogenase FAD-containing subunit
MDKALTEQTDSGRKIRILVLGGGFAGYYALKELERHLGKDPNVEVTLVSRENYIVFTPMQHEVAAIQAQQQPAESATAASSMRTVGS